MSQAFCSSKLTSNTTQEFHNHGRDIRDSTTKKGLPSSIAGRRGLLLCSTAITLLAAATTSEANDSRTALLQKYLKKSEENKVKNDKERVDNYYKRNYQDYFGFMEGTLRAKDEQQLSQSEKGILDWLDKNKSSLSISHISFGHLHH